MADAISEAAPITDENDDTWLYGDPNAEPTNGETNEENKETGLQPDGEKEVAEDDPPGEDTEAGNDDSHFNDEHFADEEETPQDENDNGENDSQLNGDSDSDDDGVKVVIGVTPAQPYQSLNIKRGGLVSQPIEKIKPAGKFTVEEMEAIGTINGVPAQEFNLDVIEDKPWRKPGADLSDYFNYGFTEDTWRAYCERQKRMRVSESGVGLGTLGVRPFMHGNEHKFYQQSPGPRRPGPGPGAGPMTGNGQYGMHPQGPNSGMINVIGGPGPQYGRQEDPNTMRTGAIQVMTADRRKYTRGKFPDMSLPPPAGEFFPGPEEAGFYPGQAPNYMGDEQWGGDRGWQPTDIKELTPGPPMGVPPPNMGPPHGMGPPNMGPPSMAPSNMGPPNIGPPNMGPPNMGPPHMMGPQMVPAPNMGGMPPMMGPPGHYGPPNMGPMGPMGPHGGDRDRERDRRDDPEYRERRDRDRERREEEERERDRDRERGERSDRERDRDRDRGRSRSIKPERNREKSHRRERSRSRERSRRHKSRSRSPVRHRESTPPPSSRHRDTSPPSRHRESTPPPLRHRDSSPPSSSRHRDSATTPPPKMRDRERSAKPKSKRKEKEESD